MKADFNVKKSFPPVVSDRIKILILGSMPGEASLRAAQYYAHPRNAFWPIMAEICGFPAELPYAERLEELKRHQIALWDVLANCVRQGSLDSAIREARCNRIPELLARHPETIKIFCNGNTACGYLKRAFGCILNKYEAETLPSTSPANARLGFEAKLQIWRSKIAPYLNGE